MTVLVGLLLVAALATLIGVCWLAVEVWSCRQPPPPLPSQDAFNRMARQMVKDFQSLTERERR